MIADAKLVTSENGELMATRDAYEFINELDRPTVEAFIKRLESRGKDANFSHFGMPNSTACAAA